MQLVLTNDIEKIRTLVAQGFCPVECSIDGQSIVDELQMDHHGEFSHLEGVALRAYRDLYGARKNDPRFVVTGTADADACFAIASLAGLLPHPSRRHEFEGQAPSVVERMSADLLELARTIDLLDTNPAGVDLLGFAYGPLLKLWQILTAHGSGTTIGLYTCVGMWVNLTATHPRELVEFFRAASTLEKRRIERARQDLARKSERISPQVLLVRGSGWGFDVWYGRDTAGGTMEEPSGWSTPVVAYYSSEQQTVTIGTPNREVAEALFGPGGLKNVFPRLQPPGWGGRESIGGSPRGMRLTIEQARAAARVVAQLLGG